MAPDDITLGELSRNIRGLEERMGRQFNEVNRQFDSVNKRLDGLQFVSRETYTVEMSNLKERVDDLEERNKWLARTVATALLFAFAAPILVALVVAR